MTWLIVFFSIIIFGTGCENPFAPALDLSASTGTSILGDQRQIDGVYQNFRQAYAFRDSTIYGQLLANNFIFIYRDYEKGVDVFWGKDEDIRTSYGLFQNVQRLDLVWNSMISSTVEPDSLKATIVRNFNLTVTFSTNDIVRVDGYANWTLERSQIADVWKITRWRDESNF
ncbi:MAG: hypothetical protein WCX28_09285 [Bacteriovoracaceae bacterium]|nr:hypothetical protein [Bacteroidota bacterium]